MVGERMMGSEEVIAAGEDVEEFDEGFIREKLKELLGKALLHRYDFRGLEATHNKVAWELIETKANYARYGEPVLVELVSREEVGVEKACRIAKRVFEEALEHFEELKIKRTGKTMWKAKLPGERWRLYVRKKPNGHWSVEVRLFIKVAKLRLPDALRLPSELLEAAQTGWIYGDATYIADRGEVVMTTTQTWQVASFPGFWPGKEVTVYVKSVVIHETRVSVEWFIRVHGVRNAPREWTLRKEEKRSLILAEIERAKGGEIDIVRALKLALFYAADGKYPGPNTAKCLLEFGVGGEPYWVRTEGSIRLAKMLLERAPQVVAFLCLAGCKKAMFLARLAFVEPKRDFSPWYLEVCGVKLNLRLTGNKNCYHLMAQVYINENEELRGFPERARAEGLEVRRVVAARRNGKVYYAYRAGQKELLRYADKHPEVYDTLIAFVEEELKAMPSDHPARPSVERLLERLRKAREKAFKRLGNQDAKARDQ